MAGHAATPGISVVICAYAAERWAALVEAVESVRRQALPALETIVVIDHNPALLARAREELPGGHVMANRGLRGLSDARNTGVAAAAGEVVAFLDDDAVAAPDWLEWLARRHADPRVLGVGGAVEPRWAAPPPAGFPPEFLWVVGCTYRGMPEELAAVRNPIGANMALRREVLRAAGGFRPGIGRVGRLPLGCEETELCIRARRERPDGVFLYEPRARVAHLVPRERTTWRYFGARCLAEGVSKAHVAQWTGPGDALATERAYVRRTLPAGFLRGVAAAGRGDVSGLGRAARILTGLSLTATGYLAGRVRFATATTRRRQAQALEA
jgi:glycosyltransferase involved in cell wall biosynthesis